MEPKKTKNLPAEAEQTEDQPQLPDNVVILDEPIARGKTNIDQIYFRKPASGELRGLSLTEVLQMEFNTLQKLIPRISTPALTEHEVGMLDPADLVECGGVIAGFFVRKKAKEEFLTA